MNWFVSRGHRVLCFLPDHMVDYDAQARLRRIEKSQILNEPTPVAKLVDNVSLLIKLKSAGIVATTPSRDYDDSYCICMFICFDIILFFSICSWS